ncbi:MAG: DUF3592 domain-containing protein [Bacteroidales bacterium]|nr:DUF3592 domain-containing protein [Bacteroidales bacterium]
MGKEKSKNITPKDHYTRNSIIFLAVFFGLLFLWKIRCDYKYWRTYDEHPAQITRISTIFRGKAGYMWKVEYQYSIDDKTYKDDEEFFHKSDYGDRQIGDTIIVEVSTNNPGTSRIAQIK